MMSSKARTPEKEIGTSSPAIFVDIAEMDISSSNARTPSTETRVGIPVNIHQQQKMVACRLRPTGEDMKIRSSDVG